MQHLRGSKTFMTKTELIDTAEASGLSAKPIKGGGVTSYHGGPPTGMPLHVVLYQLMPTCKTGSLACLLQSDQSLSMYPTNALGLLTAC